MRILLLLPFLAATQVSAQTYKYYGGNLHAHTAYSDGNQEIDDPAENDPKASFAFAKQSTNFHFLGISEHNHKKAGMKVPANYKKGLQQATAANQNNKFVSLYGMEYGLYPTGHVLIYGVDKLIGWEPGNFDIENASDDYTGLWKKIAKHPKAFAMLAHPKKTDFQNLLALPYDQTADKVICGVAVISGPHKATGINYKSAAKPKPKFFRDLLAKGYHVAPTVDHDNHHLTFGRMSSSRTIVLSRSLHRDSILQAIREMRFYASTDWNVKVSYTINKFPMGKQINTRKPINIDISITDDDASDKVEEIKIMYGEVMSETPGKTFKKLANKSTLTFTHDQPRDTTFYYYLEITQKDKDIIYTAPIWVHRLP